jgi:DNA-binding NtrC family response regulator
VQKAAEVAPTGVTVLITGENGTGKSILARVIHGGSPRRSGPFIPVNCGAIPDELKESELFGHEKGSFTGATSQRKGKFELADGGTLFLDEVGEMSPKLQVALLKVLEEGEIQRVGGNRIIKVNVRVIAATNRDLTQSVREGKFREDLYYRLNVIQLRMPSLAERLEDIPELADHFVLKHAAKLHKSVAGLAFGAAQVLMRHDWKGNVRELENFITAALVFARSDRITREDLLRLLQQSNPADGNVEDTLKSAVEQAQRSVITRRLEQTDHNVPAAADLLDCHPSTLYRLMEQLGIE